MADRRVLVETEHLLAIEQPAPSSAAFVTFSPLGVEARGDRFWGDDFLAASGFAAVGIVAKRANWFPPGDMRAVVDATRHALAGRTVLTYGTSQGGYGALKFGGALGAAGALAFAPQWSIDPADVRGFDKRFAQYHQAALHNGSAITPADLCPTNIVVYDPLEAFDRPNAERLLRLPRTQGVCCPFSGHFAVTMLAEARTARELLTRMVQEASFGASDVRQILRRSRRSSPSYRRARVSELSRRRTKLQDLARYAETTTDEELPIHRCLVALAQGRRQDAVTFLDGASDEAIRSFDVISLWNLLRAAELPAGELRLLGTIDRHYAESLTHQLHAVNILQGCGRHEEAVARLEWAVTLPGVADHLDMVTAIAQLVGRLDIAHAVGMRPDVAAALSPGRRREWRLRLAHDYRQTGQRGKGFALLHDMASDKTSTVAELQEVARRIEAAGEAGYALDIRNRLLASRPDDEILQVEVIEAMSRLDTTQAMERALAMAAKPSADGAVKLRLAVLLSYNSRQKDAVRLARQALTLGADPVACRVCLVRSLAALKDFGGAAVEMTALLSQDIPALECRELSDSALVIGRPDLAVSLGEKHLARQPNDTGAVLHFGNVALQAKQYRRARGLLLALLSDIAGGRSVSEPDIVRLTQLFGSLGDIEAEERAMHEGLRRFSVNAELLGRKAATGLFAGSRAAQATRDWDDVPLSRRPGSSRGLLRRIFGSARP